MTTIAEDIKAEIGKLQERIDAIIVRMEGLKKAPKVFNVTFQVTTCPNTWCEDHVDERELRTHIENWWNEVEGSFHLNDPGDEIQLVDVTEIKYDCT